MSSTIDITEKVAKTEKKLRKWHSNFLRMAVIWMIIIPAMLGIYTYFHGLNPAVNWFCLAGSICGFYCGGFVTLDNIVKSWFMRPLWWEKNTLDQ